ncbi:MAG TPA: DUF2844 domain-containing protein [Terriglobales bacterium]|nr:DUF2844 domain-containing protein [Terriglobales bacterium]
MKTMLERWVAFPAWFLLGMVCMGWSCPARAALGGDVASVEADRAHMNASLQVTAAEGYAVQSMKTPGGTVVSEYVAPGGRVFAVAWHGPFLPEMQQILGTYFQQYSAGLQARKKVYGRHPLNLELPGLVVQAGGRMRAYMGRAYIPEMLPPGLKVEGIK